jgi:uncharacterized membrane protein
MTPDHDDLAELDERDALDDLDLADLEDPAPPQPRLTRLGWTQVVGGVLGFVAAFALILDRIELLKDPDFVPSCSINPLLSCGTIMQTDQAAVFGFPNPLMGIATFPVVILFGVLIAARTPLPRFAWRGLLIGSVLGFAFVHWLVFQSLYVIGALCPYCMVAWVGMDLVFFATLAGAIRNRSLGGVGAGSIGRFVASAPGLLATVWVVLVVLLIVVRFSDRLEYLIPF